MTVQVFEQTTTACETGELTEIAAHVKERTAGRVRQVRLVLRGGGVVLHGRCRTYYAKQLAQHALMKVTSLPILANEIEVLGPAACQDASDDASACSFDLEPAGCDAG